MEKLSLAVFAIRIFGGIHDLLTRKIPNWFTFSAMALGLFAQLWLLGLPGLLDSVLGIGCGFVLLFPVFALGYMGAGDVKLLMAVGAWVGWQQCFQVALLAVGCGALYAFFEILYRGRARAVAVRTYSFLRSLFVPGLVIEKLRLDENRKFAFGICIAIGVAGVTFLRQQGRLP